MWYPLCPLHSRKSLSVHIVHTRSSTIRISPRAKTLPQCNTRMKSGKLGLYFLDMVDHFCSLIIPCVDQIIECTELINCRLIGISFMQLRPSCRCRLVILYHSQWAISQCRYYDWKSPLGILLLHLLPGKCMKQIAAPQGCFESQFLELKIIVYISIKGGTFSSRFFLLLQPFQRCYHAISRHNLHRDFLRSKTKWLTRLSVSHKSLIEANK